MKEISMIDTTIANVRQLGLCGYKNPKKEGFLEKLGWVHERFADGLKIINIYSEQDGSQGMIEYIPGQYCWRPVHADGCMFIDCLFVGFKSAYKNKGYASLLLQECINDAKKEKMYGVAAVTRKGSFMAGKDIFLKHGFEVKDTARSDFELVVKSFKKGTEPSFKAHLQQEVGYKNGLTIFRSDQCPYTVKNVKEITETCREEYGIEPKIIHLTNYEQAQSSPCAFGTFCIIYNGVIIAEHPISNSRFNNIMKKLRG